MTRVKEGKTILIGFGQQALLSIISHLAFIALAWYALQALNFEKFLRANRVFQARLLYLLLAIVLGSIVSNFFLDYLSWTRDLPQLVQ
jgi:uncharacterized integral membrane protein (TIGR02327 family)